MLLNSEICVEQKILQESVEPVKELQIQTDRDNILLDNLSSKNLKTMDGYEDAVRELNEEAQRLTMNVKVMKLLQRQGAEDAIIKALNSKQRLLGFQPSTHEEILGK